MWSCSDVHLGPKPCTNQNKLNHETLNLKTWLQDEDFVVLVFVYKGPNLQPLNQQP